MPGFKIGEAHIEGDGKHRKYVSFSYEAGMIGTGTGYKISEDGKTLTLRWIQVSWPRPAKKWNPHLFRATGKRLNDET